MTKFCSITGYVLNSQYQVQSPCWHFDLHWYSSCYHPQPIYFNMIFTISQWYHFKMFRFSGYTVWYLNKYDVIGPKCTNGSALLPRATKIASSSLEYSTILGFWELCAFFDYVNNFILSNFWILHSFIKRSMFESIISIFFLCYK